MVCTRQVVATVLGVLALTLLGGVAPGPAKAPAAAAPLPMAENDDGEPGRLELVLDSSGSMGEPASGGQTKIAAAKEALRAVIGGLPDEAEVGLRVYGATVFERTDPGACTDSQQVVPIGTDNRQELREAIAGYRPYGETPIAHALREAAEDLGGEGHRTIVLVSDGEATCPPSPCVVARQLAEDGIDLRIDVVGLAVSGKARAQLQCIADAAHGDYYDADSAEDLGNALDRLSTRALRPFRVTGEPVDGGDTADAAAPVTAGQYVDTLGPAGSENWYLVERQVPGSSLQLGIAGKAGESMATTDAIELETFPAGSGTTVSCGSATNVIGASSEIFGSSQTIDPRALGPVDPACAEDDLLVLVRRQDDGGTAPVDTELLVVEEPPVSSTNGLPPGVEDNAWTDPAPSGQTQPALGGTSFADAEPIEPGTYTGDIVPGETQVFAVEVDWGQQPVFDVTFPERRGALAEAADYSVELRARLFTPVRGEFSYSADFGGPEPSATLLSDEAVRIGAAGAEVRYLNRASSDDAVASASIPGTYYLTVEASPDAEGQSYTLPFTLRVDLPSGAAGEPDYEGTDATTPEQSSAPSPEGDADDESTAESADNRAQERSSDGIGPLRMVAAVAVAGLGVGAIGWAAFLLLARRRTP